MSVDKAGKQSEVFSTVGFDRKETKISTDSKKIGDLKAYMQVNCSIVLKNSDECSTVSFIENFKETIKFNHSDAGWKKVKSLRN